MSTSVERMHEAPDVAPADVWRRAYEDAAAWPRWNTELASAELEGPFDAGTTARVRFRTGLRLRFTLVEVEEGRVFTDEARLPGARMGHRHVVEPLPGGGTRLTNRIYIRGPLARLWWLVMGRRARRALATGQPLIAEVAYGRNEMPSSAT